MLILAGAAHTFLIPPILYLLKLGKLLSGNKLKVCLVSLFLLSFFLWTYFSKIVEPSIVLPLNEKEVDKEKVINGNVLSKSVTREKESNKNYRR